MIFFTDITTDASKYCLLNIKQYNDPRKEDKKLFFVDPGVWELKKLDEYTHVKKLHEIAKNPQPFEFISIDYPCDMNPTKSELFISKSIENNFRYKDNLQYICAIQSKFQDFKDFKKQFFKLKQIFWRRNKIVGIGNLCRFKRNNLFIDKVMNFLKKRSHGIYWLHFYGLCKESINKHLSYQLSMDLRHFMKSRYNRRNAWPWRCIISVDSTNWTRGDKQLKEKYHGRVCCRKHNRDEYFVHYVQKIEEKTDLFF